LAGSRYQAGLGDTSQLGEVSQRGEISGALSVAVIESGSRDATLQQLCQSGVSYIWLEGTLRSGVIQPVYSNDSVSIYSLKNQCADVAN